MKFLHTSDWHIGRQFHHASLLDDQRHVLQQIIDAAREHHVDAILIAGDIYDRAIPPTEAIRLVDDVLHTLTVEHNIPVILIAGNHDSQERLSFAARQLANQHLHIVGFQPEQPQPILLKDTHGEVAIYGIPYAEPAIIRELYHSEVRTNDEAMELLCQQIHTHQQDQQYPRSIVLSHCFIGGSTLSDSERPLSVGGSEQVAAQHFKNFNYTALGHLHAAQSRHQDTLRYSGSILKYSFSEASHTKSVTLVDMDTEGHCQIDTLPLSPLHDVRIIEGQLDELLAAAHTLDDEARHDYLLARLTDTGALLEPMRKLQAVYPNLLALERTGLLRKNTTDCPTAPEQLRHNELDMFQDFYRHIQHETMNNDQQAMLKELLSALNKEC